MGAFSRSWELTKTTLHIMKKDKEIFIFPVLSIVLSILFLIGFLIFFFIGGLISLVNGFNISAFGYISIFIFYLFMALLGTFFSVCVVYTAAMRFSGKDATFGDSIGFAFKRIGKVILWSLVSATFGLILKILEGFGKKLKGIGKILFGLFIWILGASWAIATTFVFQGIVYRNLGPFASIKDSIITLKKTWGESLIKYIGFGASQFLLYFIGFLIGIPLIVLGATSGLGIWFILAISFLLIAYIVALISFFSIANDVFNTALYVYASTGKIPEGYNPEQISSAFKPEKSLISSLY